MKKITLEISEELYNQIQDLTNWINLNNKFKGKEVSKNQIDDFIKGAVISKIEDIETIRGLMKQDVSEEVIVKNRFKEIAKKKKIKQVDICNKVGIKKSNLSLILNNKKPLRMDVFFKIWLLLGSPPLSKCLYIEKD